MTEPVTAEWLTIKQAARRAKFGYDKVYNATRLYEETDGAHGLRSYQTQPGAARRIRIEDLDAWVMGAPSVEEGAAMAAMREKISEGWEGEDDDVE